MQKKWDEAIGSHNIFSTFLPRSNPIVIDKMTDKRDCTTTEVRRRQWMYLGPILAAPLAHIAVPFYREAKTQKHRQLILGIGVIGSTFLTLSMRLYLMAHAGYPGKDDATTIQSRIVEVRTKEEKDEILNPSTSTIAKEIWRGFG